MISNFKYNSFINIILSLIFARNDRIAYCEKFDCDAKLIVDYICLLGPINVIWDLQCTHVLSLTMDWSPLPKKFFCAHQNQDQLCVNTHVFISSENTQSLTSIIFIYTSEKEKFIQMNIYPHMLEQDDAMSHIQYSWGIHFLQEYVLGHSWWQFDHSVDSFDWNKICWHQ